MEITNESIPKEVPTATSTESKPANTSKKSKKAESKPEHQIPRGKPKSNRIWKTPKSRFSSIQKSRNRSPFVKKVELRHELKAIKERSKEIKEERKQAAVAKHQRRIENAERRLANERRAEIVQIIKNPAKLKRMKKKQLRMIQKRDITQVKAV